MLRRSEWVRMGSVVCVGLAILAQSRSECAAPGTDDADRRAQPVSVAEPHRGLGEVVARLGAQAEMRLTAVQHLADRRVTMFARERPLRELMSRLEELWSLPQFPARWRSSAKEPQRAELHQDPHAELEQERRYQADRDRIMQSLERAIALSESLDATPPAGDDPVLRNLLHTGNWRNGGRAFMRMLGGMSPQERQTLASGGLIQVPFSSLPARTRDTLANEYLLPVYPGFGNQAANLADQVLEMRLTLDESDPAQQWRLDVSTHKTGSTSVLTWGLPLAPLEIAGDAALDAPPADSLPSALRQPVPPSVRDALLRLGTPANRESWKEWSDFLGFLHREAGFALLSDYHHDRKTPDPRKLAEAKDYAQLIGDAARACGYRWRWSKGSLLFRNRTWYADDRSELPATLEAQAEASLATHGYLDVESVLALSQLSGKQLRRLADRAPNVGDLTSHRRIFGWLRALSPSQRRQAASERGLRAADSPPQARALLFPNGTNDDPTLGMFAEPAEIYFSGFGQAQEPQGMVLRVKVQGPLRTKGPWVECRFVQPLREKALSNSNRPAEGRKGTMGV